MRNVLSAKGARRECERALMSPLFSFFLCSDGAHDGDDVGGRTGRVRPQRPADLRRVWRQGHWLPLQRHDVRGLQGILQVGATSLRGESFVAFCVL